MASAPAEADAAPRETLPARVARKIRATLQEARDRRAEARIRRDPAAWPCRARKYLLVGCEGSGTTPISHLLWRGGSMRFLLEGRNPWVWRAYMDMYRGLTTIRDYPRLQLYDAVKVPGFAAILPLYAEGFPDARVVCVVRDPRDVLAGAYRTWGVEGREALRDVPWVKQDWLGIAADDPVDRLAWRWRLYLEAAGAVEGVHHVRYEDFCADKVGCIALLAEAVGTPVDAGRVGALRDVQASAAKVRAYAPSGPGGWRCDPRVPASDARRVEAICGDLMARWGYLG